MKLIEEFNKSLEHDLQDVLSQYQGNKIDSVQVMKTLNNIVNYYNKIKQQETKLNNEENEFLVDWLYDDLHIELEKRREQDEQSPTARKFLPIIIKKLELNKGE